MWDDLQKERIDRKNTLASHVKAQIALLVGSSNFKNRTANKAYIPAPIDINVLWNKLIEAHLYDIQPQDVYNRLQQLAAIMMSLLLFLKYSNEYLKMMVLLLLIMIILL